MKPDGVNAANQDGKGLLHIAALSNNVEMCKVSSEATLQKREVCAQLFDPPKCFKICHIYGKRKPM